MEVENVDDEAEERSEERAENNTSAMVLQGGANKHKRKHRQGAFWLFSVRVEDNDKGVCLSVCGWMCVFVSWWVYCYKY